MKEVYMCEVCSQCFTDKYECWKHELQCKNSKEIIKGLDPNILEYEVQYEDIAEINGRNFIHKLICKKNDGSIDTYKAVKRKAKKGDLVYIIKPSGTAPFNELYLGKIFEVTTDEIDVECVQLHVSVGYFALYHSQYVVLEKI